MAQNTGAVVRPSASSIVMTHDQSTRLCVPAYGQQRKPVRTAVGDMSVTRTLRQNVHYRLKLPPGNGTLWAGFPCRQNYTLKQDNPAGRH